MIIQTGKIPGKFLVQSTVSYTQMLNTVMDLHYRNFLVGGYTDVNTSKIRILHPSRPSYLNSSQGAGLSS